MCAALVWAASLLERLLKNSNNTRSSQYHSAFALITLHAYSSTLRIVQSFEHGISLI